MRKGSRVLGRGGRGEEEEGQKRKKAEQEEGHKRKGRGQAKEERVRRKKGGRNGKSVEKEELRGRMFIKCLCRKESAHRCKFTQLAGQYYKRQLV